MKKIIFYIVFSLMFLAGGFLNYFGILSYKMIFGALVPLALVPFIKIKPNSFFYATAAFALVTIVSAIINQTNLLLTLWFFQNVIIPFLMYITVVNYLNEKNIVRVYKFVFFIAAIQLPIILLQRFFYSFITRFASVSVSDYDIGFGSFYTSDDIALSFFILGVLLFLLFDDKHNYFVKRKVVLIVWLTLTILVLNSKISYLILSLILGYYLLTRVRLTYIFYFLFLGSIVFTASLFFGLKERVKENITALGNQLAFDIELKKAEYFYKNAQGNRAATLLHLATEDIKIIGEGPHSLYNPITNKYNKGGDTSQLISFYVELGLIGLLLSYVLVYAIIRGLYISKFTRLYFLVFCLVSVVSNVFLDASIMMVFCIFCCAHLIPNKDSAEVERESIGN